MISAKYFTTKYVLKIGSMQVKYGYNIMTYLLLPEQIIKYSCIPLKIFAKTAPKYHLLKRNSFEKSVNLRLKVQNTLLTIHITLLV